MAAIDREKLLNYAKTEEDRLFVAKLADKIHKSGKGYLVYTNFLDPHQRMLARKIFRELNQPFVFDGGYTDAERVVAFLIPGYMESDGEDPLDTVRNDENYPVSVVQAQYSRNRFSQELTHRDFLGAIMNLGIKRENFGDILVHHDFAQIVTFPEIASYLERNLARVGRTEVDARIVPTSEIVLPSMKAEEKTVTVASLRLDAVVAEGYSISRTKAAEYIKAGKVFLDFEECMSASEPVDAGNVISLRGKGRIILDSIGDKSRKNRIFIRIKRLV